jgi:hypothetical protein
VIDLICILNRNPNDSLFLDFAQVIRDLHVIVNDKIGLGYFDLLASVRSNRVNAIKTDIGIARVLSCQLDLNVIEAISDLLLA